MDDPVTSPITTRRAQTTFHSVRIKHDAIFNQEAYMFQVQRDVAQKSQPYTGQASTEELH